MVKRDQQPSYSASQWQTAAEFSLPGEAGCAHTAAERVAESLAIAQLPHRILMGASQAVARAMEEEMSRVEAGQARRAFTVLVRTQSTAALETSVDEADGGALCSHRKGWGFFLTEKRMTGTELGHPTNHVVITVHLYQEGHPA